MIGEVVNVHHWPKSSKELMHELNNEELSELLVTNAGGPPVLIEVKLQHDEKTFSGFAWSTRTGPQLKIPQGTLGRAKITVRELKPAALVIPWLRETIGI